MTTIASGANATASSRRGGPGHRRAEELSQCYTLARLAAGVVPSGKPLSSLLNLALRHSTDSEGGETARADEDAAGPARLEVRIKAQLRRAYFDSFRSFFTSPSDPNRDPDTGASDPTSSSWSSSSPLPRTAEQSLAWSRLARDLVDVTLPLIPSRMRADPVLYNLDEPTTQPTSMRTVVEKDLLQRPPEATTASAAAGPEFHEEWCLAKLERLVRVLQRLCAPARDPDVRALLARLDDRADPSRPSRRRHPDEPNLVDLVQETLDLAEAMKADLDRFHAAEVRHHRRAVLSDPLHLRDAAAADEEERGLRALIEQEAASRERHLVVEWYAGDENVRRATTTWCLGHSSGHPPPPQGQVDPPHSDRVATAGREEVAHALVETLFAREAVALPDLDTTPAADPDRVTGQGPLDVAAAAAAADTSAGNVLPPVLVVLAPLLFELQNQLQAVVILACLATLVTSTYEPATASSPAMDPLFQRLWSILDMSITRLPSPRDSATASGVPADEVPEPAHLAHLADEILAHFAAASSPSPHRDVANSDLIEARVRAGVERILRYEDPVWRLLSNRLQAATEAALLETIRRSSCRESAPPEGGQQPQQVPSRLQTGRLNRGAGPHPSPRSSASSAATYPRTNVLGARPAKGFDRPAVLAEKTSELVDSRIVGEVWGHVDRVWSRVLEWVAE